MTNLDKFIEVMNETFDAHFKPENMKLMCTPCGALKQGRHACNHFHCLGCENWWQKEYKPPKEGKHMSRPLPQAGEIWRHFKQHDYKIIACPVVHSETNERMVCYQALYGAEGIYVRPLTMFMSEVDRNKYPDVAQVYRFEKVMEVMNDDGK